MTAYSAYHDTFVCSLCHYLMLASYQLRRRTVFQSRAARERVSETSGTRERWCQPAASLEFSKDARYQK